MLQLALFLIRLNMETIHIIKITAIVIVIVIVIVSSIINRQSSINRHRHRHRGRRQLLPVKLYCQVIAVALLP